MRKIFYLLVILFQICFFYIIVISSLKGTVTGSTFVYKKYINAVVPEGWGFFTKDPREDMTEIYVQENGQMKRIDFLNNDLRNWFGLSRKSRRVAMDVGIIYEQIKNETFHASLKEADENPVEIKFWERLYALQNYSTGELYFVQKEYTPWAWYKNIGSTVKNEKYIQFKNQIQ